MRSRTSIVALVALAFVWAMTLAFGFADASALSVRTPSVTVDLNETGVSVDVRAVTAESTAATGLAVAKPPVDPSPVDLPVVESPVVDQASTVRPTRAPVSFATQQAEEASEVPQATTEPNPDAERAEPSGQSPTPMHAGRDDRGTADTRPSGDRRPNDPRPFEPGGGAAAPPSVLAPTASPADEAAPVPPAPAPRGDRRSSKRGKPHEHGPDDAAPSPVPPLAATAAGGSASATSGGGGAMAATLVVLLGFAASSAYSLLRTPNRSRRAPDVARALERPG